VLGVLAWTAAVQVSHLAPKIPEYRDNIEAKLNSVNEYAVAVLSKMTQTTGEMRRDLSSSEQDSEPRGTTSCHSPFAWSPHRPARWKSLVACLAHCLSPGDHRIVIVFVVFFLIGREDLRDRFIHLAGKGEVTLTTQMLEDASTRVSRYLSTLFLLNVTFGISVGIAALY